MQFSFEVDPSLDVAIGLEADFVDDVTQEYASEPYDDGIALAPTEAKPGSEDKVRMLSARYAAGVPLWHDDDCYDHGPGEIGDGFGSMEDDIDDLDD